MVSVFSALIRQRAVRRRGLFRSPLTESGKVPIQPPLFLYLTARMRAAAEHSVVRALRRAGVAI
jgi:hypothetical protein